MVKDGEDRHGLQTNLNLTFLAVFAGYNFSNRLTLTELLKQGRSSQKQLIVQLIGTAQQELLQPCHVLMV